MSRKRSEIRVSSELPGIGRPCSRDALGRRERRRGLPKMVLVSQNTEQLEHPVHLDRKTNYLRFLPAKLLADREKEGL
jgi:hypothetical protein